MIQRYAYVSNNPLKFIDPTGKFLQLFVPNVHGDYCGGTANGKPQFDEYGDYREESNPVDDLDRACQRHDSAYGDYNKVINPEWRYASKRAETDFALMVNGLQYMQKKPIEGAVVAYFGFVLFATYSAPTATISFVIDLISSLF